MSGDPDRLQQVVWNLLSNAIKFTEPGGQVEVDVVCAGGFVTIHVRDNGRGIAQRRYCPTCLSASGRPTQRRRGGTAASASGSPSCDIWSSCTAAPCAAESDGPAPRVPVQRAPPGRGRVGARRRTAGGRQPRAAPAARGPRARRGRRGGCAGGRAPGAGAVRRRGAHGGNTQGGDGDPGSWAPTVLVSDIAMPDEDGYALIRRLRGARGGPRRPRAGARLHRAGPCRGSLACPGRWVRRLRGEAGRSGRSSSTPSRRRRPRRMPKPTPTVGPTPTGVAATP